MGGAAGGGSVAAGHPPDKLHDGRSTRRCKLGLVPQDYQVIAISPEFHGAVVGDFCSLQAAEAFANGCAKSTHLVFTLLHLPRHRDLIALHDQHSPASPSPSSRARRSSSAIITSISSSTSGSVAPRANSCCSQRTVVARQADSHGTLRPDCRSCGGQCHVKDWRPHCIATLFGEMTVRLPGFCVQMPPHRDG